MELDNEFDGQHPGDYLNFLKENPNGDEIAFNDYKDEDPSNNYSIWTYFHEGEDVCRISDSFKESVLN